MRKKHNSLVTLGITSLFLIFAVLGMVILALLTLGSSRSDLNMSLKSMEQTTAYYDACTEASDFCLTAEKFLQNTLTESADKQEYFQKAALLKDDGLTFDADTQTLAFDVPFSDSQALHVEMTVLYPQETEGSVIDIHTWQTISTAAWTPDTHQPVFSTAGGD